MSTSDQQYLTILQTTRNSIATDGLRHAQEEMRSLGFISLKELSDEIERIESRIEAAAGNRRIMNPIRRIDH